MIAACNLQVYSCCTGYNSGMKSSSSSCAATMVAFCTSFNKKSPLIVDAWLPCLSALPVLGVFFEGLWDAVEEA